MKTLYTLLLIACAHTLSAQCVPQITIAPLGLGSFSFTASNGTDTVEATTFTWVIESDTVIVDSAYTLLVHHFDTNGIYNIQLSMVDTSASCLFDTVWQLVVEDADYVPLLDSVNIWHYRGNQVPYRTKPAEGIRSWCSENTMMYTGGDTVIGIYSYKKLYYDYNMFPSGGCLWGYIREDVAQREVYVIKDDGPTEVKIYDFSMQVGDSIELDFTDFGGGYFYDGVFRLDTIVITEFSDGIKRKEFLLNRVGGGPHTLRWVEGIGNLGEMLYLFSRNEEGWSYYTGDCPGFPHDYYKFLICFEHAQRVYYDSCARANSTQYPSCVMYYDTCRYDGFCGSINELSSLASMDVFPNPAQTKVIVKLDVKIADGFALQVLDLQGKAVSTSYNPGRLGEGKHNLPLTLSVLPAGMYMLECRTGEGAIYKRLVIE